jgi:hypothetical protein
MQFILHPGKLAASRPLGPGIGLTNIWLRSTSMYYRDQPRRIEPTKPFSANLKQLEEVGFMVAGFWQLSGNEIGFELRYFADSRNVLYAFAVDGDLVYVGKSNRTLRARMQSYQFPAKAPAKIRDNRAKNNARIREQLLLGRRVAIYALCTEGHIKYRGVAINLAAGMEDALIHNLAPDWNLIGRESRKRSRKERKPRQQSLHLWLYSRLIDQLELLAKQNSRSMMAEASEAITKHLEANGLWPPPKK